jgi:hypothetical protein
MSKKNANLRSGDTTYSVVEAKDLILIRKRPRRVVHKRKPKQTIIPAPPKGGKGCHLAAIVYDFKLDQTTFMYECDHKFANGSNSYTKTLPGKLDSFV